MTITLTREEAQQVLDALEMYLTMSTYEEAKLLEVDIAPRAIETLRARLSAPEECNHGCDDGACPQCYHDQTQLKPEPVAWEYCGALFYNKEEVFAWYERGDISDTPPKPLYTAPPQRERVQFPTMLRKMWSGTEVQAWLDENVNQENNND
jgi:hypothetical protein